MIVRILLSALCIVALPLVAHAQEATSAEAPAPAVVPAPAPAPSLTPVECTEGRVTVEDSGGACCWPGQAWLPERNRCAGAPTCPQGRQVLGEDCIAPPTGEREAIGGAFFEEPIRHRRNSFVEALHQSGTPTLFAVGYGPALMLAFSGLIPGTSAAPYVYNFIPIAGPLLSLSFCGMGAETCATPWYWVYTIGDTIVQVAGAVFILGAMLTQPVSRDSTVTSTRSANNRRIRWGVSPGAGSTPFGATVGVVTF